MARVSLAITGLICTQLAMSPGVVFAQAATDPLGHRLKLSFFDYAGSQQGEPKIYFGRFKGILRDKLTVLVEELPDARDHFDYLQRLSLEPPGEGGLEDRLTTEESLQNYWDQSRSLLLFRGTLFSDANGPYFAQSRVYLGDLHGRLPHASITLRLPVRADDFPTTSDTHSLIVYYALAQDAIRMGDDRSRVIELLSRAQDRIRDLKSQSAPFPQLGDLEKAIELTLLTQKATPSHP